jgi:precorrin-6A/cobalt-precorrin-6A reductase
MKRVLILGGTGDAAELAAQAAELPLEIISSLAGRTRLPTVPAGSLRVGGFGGEAGLVEYLQQQQIDLLIDATHPFAAQISWNAAAAARICQIPHLLLLRPAWQKHPDDNWLEVTSNAAAADMLPELGQRVFLTIGRQELVSFAHLHTLWFLMRMIDPPQDTAIPPGELILERGPFTLEHERMLLQTHRIEVIVSKNSGGESTYAKIIAARQMHLPVVMVQRPMMPTGKQVATVEDAIVWLRDYAGT